MELLSLLLKYVAEFLAHALGKEKEERFRTELQSWRNALARESNDVLVIPLFAIPESILSKVLGPRLLSLKSFWKTAKVASLLLIICFVISGLFYGFTGPFETFSKSVAVLQKAVADHPKQYPTDLFQFHRNVSDLANLQGGGYDAVYSLYYFLMTFAIACLFTWLSLALCHRLLKTVMQLHDLFSISMVLLSTGVVSVFMLAAESGFLSVVLYPFFWPAAPLFFQAFRHSAILGVILAIIGGICAPLFYWFTASAWLRIALVLSLFPCLAIGGLILLNLIWRPFSRTICRSAVFFLDIALGSRKGIFSFISLCFAAAIPLCTCIVWLAELKFTPLFISALAVFSLLLPGRYSRTAPSGIRPYVLACFLFIAGMVLLCFGYYSQLIFDLVLFPRTFVPFTNIDPLINSLVPGALAGSLFAYGKFTDRGPWWLVLGILCITILTDFVAAITGNIAFSDFVRALPFNAAGSLLAAFIVSWSTRRLFPEQVPLTPATEVVTSSDGVLHG